MNTLKYVSVYGSSASTTDGVIKFATSTSGNGNDNNIDNCAVTSSGNRPVNAIYSLGSAASDNSSNTISNNAIYDFINSSTSSNGIYLGANSTAWTISTNSFTRQPVLCP
jgi:hypothetical protein